MIRKICLGLITLLSIGFTTTASAVPVLWTVDYANNGLGDRFTLAGSFIFDVDTSIFSAINVSGIDVGGNNILDTTYTLTDPADTNTASMFTFWDSLSVDRTGAKRLAFNLGGGALTNAGGVVSLLASTGPSVFASLCTNSSCGNTLGYSIAVSPNPADGSLVGVPLSVPAPASLALFGLGLAGLGISRRKRTTQS